MMPPVEPELKAALVNLRRVKSLRLADGTKSISYAEWREQIARALLRLAEVLPSEEEKYRVRAEAEVAFEEAMQIRRDLNGDVEM